jgi:hypothetical protein
MSRTAGSSTAADLRRLAGRLVGDAGVVEVKSVIAPTHYDNLQRGTFDPAYKWQLVGHLDCTGREWVDFSATARRD